LATTCGRLTAVTEVIRTWSSINIDVAVPPSHSFFWTYRETTVFRQAVFASHGRIADHIWANDAATVLEAEQPVEGKAAGAEEEKYELRCFS
jgi:hypothetical protein